MKRKNHYFKQRSFCKRKTFYPDKGISFLCHRQGLYDILVNDRQKIVTSWGNITTQGKLKFTTAYQNIW